MRKSILAVAASGLIIMGLAAAVPASAEYNYSCASCATINGPNETVRYNEGINYTFNQLCVVLWQNNGGGNYNTVGNKCVSGSWTTWTCSNVGSVNGHGEVYNSESAAHMAGHQDNRAC